MHADPRSNGREAVGPRVPTPSDFSAVVLPDTISVFAGGESAAAVWQPGQDSSLDFQVSAKKFHLKVIVDEAGLAKRFWVQEEFGNLVMAGKVDAQESEFQNAVFLGRDGRLTNERT